MRDGLPTGAFEVVLFHSPDRLARRALYQEIVLEEMERVGVQPEFPNFAVDYSPEGKMLLGMQGLFAEYERTKIAERTRRGKMFLARQGALVGYYVAYGYRFIRRSESQRALVVRQMYRWLVEEVLSTSLP